VPGVLMVGPLVWLVWKGDRQARRAGWLAGLAFAGWLLLTFRPWRFLFPAVPVALLAGAVGLSVAGRWTRVVVAAVMGVGLCWMGASVLLDVESPERVPARVSMVGFALGQTGRDEFVGRIGAGSFGPILWMNENLPAGAKVLVVGEGRVFYLQRPVVWATAFDRFGAEATNGVTHVYVNFSELERLGKNYGYPRGLDLGMVQSHCGREIYRANCSTVFEWKP